MTIPQTDLEMRITALLIELMNKAVIYSPIDNACHFGGWNPPEWAKAIIAEVEK